MREAFGPPLKAAGILAFCTGLVFLLLRPPSLAGLEGMLSLIAGAIIFILFAAWMTVLAIGREMPDE